MLKRLTLVARAVRGDLKLLWFALRHPAAPRWLKVGTGLVVLYLVSPIDLLPEAIPFVGLIDDAVLVPLAVRWLLARLPAEIRADSQRRAGV
jgi:uncharacterized membrane protein YkvA (DUF1232 family)